MGWPTRIDRTPRGAGGFTLLEVVVALLLLGVCLVPAANALRSAVAVPAVAAGAAHNLDCVTSLMETVMAEPYSHLLPVAKGDATYPIPLDATCPARTVTIALYGNNATGNIGPGATDEDLLYVSVALTSATDGNPYTLTTLMTR
jgi:prepilin-type N-terminal cleavage/methylation domain-containing protein